MSHDETPIGRWSRRKRESRQSETADPPKRRGSAAPVVAPEVIEPEGPHRPWLPPLTAAEAGDPAEDPGQQGEDGDGAEMAAIERAIEELPPEEADYVRSLPKVETLNADSDFTPFLDRRVPKLLHKAALRRLWRAMPGFNFRDGLDDYDEDFSIIQEIVAAADSTYRPGRGHVDAADPVKEAPDASAGDAETEPASAFHNPENADDDDDDIEGAEGDEADSRFRNSEASDTETEDAVEGRELPRSGGSSEDA